MWAEKHIKNERKGSWLIRKYRVKRVHIDMTVIESLMNYVWNDPEEQYLNGLYCDEDGILMFIDVDKLTDALVAYIKMSVEEDVDAGKLIHYRELLDDIKGLSGYMINVRLSEGEE